MRKRLSILLAAALLLTAAPALAELIIANPYHAYQAGALESQKAVYHADSPAKSKGLPAVVSDVLGEEATDPFIEALRPQRGAVEVPYFAYRNMLRLLEIFYDPDMPDAPYGGLTVRYLYDVDPAERFSLAVASWLYYYFYEDVYVSDAYFDLDVSGRDVVDLRLPLLVPPIPEYGYNVFVSVNNMALAQNDGAGLPGPFIVNERDVRLIQLLPVAQ